MSVRWAWRMAWRDSRGQRGVLLLFVLCIVFGIAAMVAIRSLRSNLEATIAEESRSLVGADLRLQTRQPFTPALEAWIAQQGGEVSREVQFRSMASFPSEGQSRFVQVRAIEAGFPFYGELETTPSGADFRQVTDPPRALVEAGLMNQYSLSPGDTLRLGDATFEIAGALERVAGEAELAGFFAPRVFIPFESVAETALLRAGSVATYRAYLRFDEGLSPGREQALEGVKAGLFVDAGVRVTTVADRQESIARMLGRLFAFLSLVGFVALVLGGIGVGGAVQVYLQPKLASVATLRCLGASAQAAFAIYLWQISLVGLGGAFIGAGMGMGIQLVLPALLAPFLPFPITFSPDFESLVFGLIFGWLVATLFALRPLLGVRWISPLQALRGDYEPVRKGRDPWRMAVTTLLIALGVGYSVLQTPEWWQGLAFAGGLGMAYGVLFAGAVGLHGILRRVRSPRWPFVVRLALSNLYRPNNRTLFLVTTLGLGTFLISTLHLSRSSLLAQIEGGHAEDRPNLVLVDVQPDQVDALIQALETNNLHVQEVLPVVTMRPLSINGRTLREWREMPESPISNWVYSWEFRVTYRDHVLENAVIMAGEFIGRHSGEEPIPISLTDNLLDDLNVGLGDTIVWDVQGLSFQTYVSSIRQVNWELGRQNFNVLWPTGVLEAAPTMYAIASQVRDRSQIVALQRQMETEFPNVSLLDLTLIFETIDTVLRRVAFVIQFMAGFTLFTGLIVLFGALVTSRYQRVRESVFLRTLGASGGFVRALLTWEYALLGVLSAGLGVGLSVAATMAISRWIFELPFVLEPGALGLLFAAVVVLTLTTGWLNSWGIVSEPPLKVLREER